MLNGASCNREIGHSLKYSIKIWLILMLRDLLKIMWFKWKRPRSCSVKCFCWGVPSCLYIHMCHWRNSSTIPWLNCIECFKFVSALATIFSHWVPQDHIILVKLWSAKVDSNVVLTKLDINVRWSVQVSHWTFMKMIPI